MEKSRNVRVDPIECMYRLILRDCKVGGPFSMCQEKLGADA